MKTFMLLTFGFLTFAFYEMSGGADFEPASARMAAQTTANATEPAEQSTSAPEQIATAAAITKIDTSATVTRVALNLTSVSDAAATAAPRTEARIIDSSETPQVILPSLIATTTETNTLGSNPEDQGDIRTVSGNRVNVRGGPSTTYGIVNKLTRGAEVRVLEDTGDGWVLMQPMDGGAQGWMADFLLTSG